MRFRGDFEIPKQMTSLREKVEAWRLDKGGRRGMPTQLWSEAVSLASQYGAYAVSKHVGVSYNRLRELLGQKAKPTNAGSSSGEFVEVTPAASVAFGQPGASPRPSYRHSVSPSLAAANEKIMCVELRRPDGFEMVIRNGDADSVWKMATSFWGCGR